MLDYDSLEVVFGTHRLKTHFLASLTGLTPHDRKLLTAKDPTLHVVCSTFSAASNLEKTLSARFGGYSVHPAYSSKKGDSVCFITAAVASEVQQLKSNALVSSVSSVPSTLKVHESVMFVLGLVDEKLDHYSALQKLYGREHQKVDLQYAKLSVSEGVAVHKKSRARGGGIRESEVREMLSKHSPAEHLEKMTAPGVESSTVWHESIGSFQAASDNSCNFEALSVVHTGHSIEVGDLHQIQSSASPQSCYAALLAALASHPSTADIRFILPKKTNNNVIRGIVQTEARAESYPYTSAGIDGTGQVVGIGDTGVDEHSCFFRNSDGSTVARSSYKNPTFDNSKRKVIQYISYADDTDTEGGHGTHVSGTVGGSLMYDSTTYLNYNGHASGAKIAFFDMEYSSNPERGIVYPSPIGDNVFQPAYDAGARLHSNSWGGPFNLYDADTADIDDFHSTHTDFLALFAAGNDGSEGYYSLGDPAVSKNALTVGASMSSSGYIDKIAFFSSLGPTFDNRIKPDVVAPGYFTYSAKSSGTTTETCEIVDMAGTSMATPAVAGVAAQIRQYFADYNTATMDGCTYYTSASGTLSSYDCDTLSNPRGATVKALLVNSGEAMASYYVSSSYDTVEPSATLSSPPDMYEGFGRVSLQNILPYPGIEDVLNVHVVENTVSENQRFTHTVQVGDVTRPFKATLVWMDPTNTMVATKMLINNLDLKVEFQDNTVYYGNGNGADDVNNVEQVAIANPTTGTYTVTVTAGDYLSGDSQAFSLVITGGDLTFGSEAFTSSVEYDPLSCASDEKLVQMTAMDREGDGWSPYQTYKVANTDETVVKTGTMTGADKSDFMTTLSMCLPVGDYSVTLLNSQDAGDFDGMAFEVDTCFAYVSEYQPTSQFSITNTDTNYCGACYGLQISLLLSGSFYGIPYGWQDNTHYAIEQTSGGDTVYMGTLATGMLRQHIYCLGDGTYSIGMKDVAANDDFMDDDYLANYFGVEEYYISYTDSDGNTAELAKGETATVTVDGSSSDISVSGRGGSDDDDSLSTGAIVAIVIVVILIIACCVGAIVYFMCRGKAGGARQESTLEATATPISHG